MNPFINTITSQDSAVRDASFQTLCKNLSIDQVQSYLAELEEFRKQTENLYEKVRASIFLYAGYRFYLMDSKSIRPTGAIPVEGCKNFLDRNYERALSIFHAYPIRQSRQTNENLLSCLAETYHQNTFQLLSDQVRKSVRSSLGNQWMFRVGHPDEHPLKMHPALFTRSSTTHLYPLLCERTPVRLDLTHSCWSDIFFLGMDYPEGARVINISVDLGVFGRDTEIQPPLESYLRVIDEPVIRFSSLDLNESKDISDLADLFNFGNDYLGLLKAAIISSGFIPPSFEGTRFTVKEILAKILYPGLGIELVTKVNDIPKGSRLAVSTNLLASMISILMRATQQTLQLEGIPVEQERDLIASRAILGEWLGGSGGGWQDSGGVWPGIKAIEGVSARKGDAEYAVSRGRLLPCHRILKDGAIHPEFEKKLASSLILMHGGMASNVGPILEMVTEKYLLRSNDEWKARQRANTLYDKILKSLQSGNIKELAALTTHNFDDPIKTIIPWATTHFTEVIIQKAKQAFKENYWGFLMLGGMSGGGMGMFVDPRIYPEAKQILLRILRETKKEMEESLPFAMNPVVYNFAINNKGTAAHLLHDDTALLPQKYYALVVPRLARLHSSDVPDSRKIEIDLFSLKTAHQDEAYPIFRSIIGNVFQYSNAAEIAEKQQQDKETERIKKENGFDPIQHEQIRNDLRKGRIGLNRNRLPLETIIEDVSPSDVVFSNKLDDNNQKGIQAVRNGSIAMLCLAAGIGSRWTKGAGVIKAINPFIEMTGIHRSFLEIHLAKNRKTSGIFKSSIPYIIATSYLTHHPIQKELQRTDNYHYTNPLYLSEGKSIGQRFIPTERDLRFLWEEILQGKLDENKQKVVDALHETLIRWAKAKGEASDYTDNIALQRLTPLGHWYEVPNLIRNGILAGVLREHPSLQHLLLHNIDTLGVNLSPEILNYHISSGNALTFEVLPRRMEDHGGGLARINGKVRLLEGLAQPSEEDEFKLSYYNSMTTWIHIDKLLKLFGLERSDLFTKSEAELADAVRNVARNMPTYVTIKDVKYRWGHGQEDIYPVAQIEKLWSDMSALSDVQCGYVVVPRIRGQQLKDPAQLDSWVTDGSKEYVEEIADFEL